MGLIKIIVCCLLKLGIKFKVFWIVLKFFFFVIFIINVFESFGMLDLVVKIYLFFLVIFWKLLLVKFNILLFIVI